MSFFQAKLAISCIHNVAPSPDFGGQRSIICFYSLGSRRKTLCRSQPPGHSHLGNSIFGLPPFANNYDVSDINIKFNRRDYLTSVNPSGGA